jgi:vesicle coat complex subunit
MALKKMVYLYLCNYAEQNPDLSIMAVNTLVQDCKNQDPMVRGLALRSLTGLRVANITEYITAPVQAALVDQSGYVRKTGVVGILKMHHVSPDLVADGDFVDKLYDMIGDRDANVSMNCLVVLSELLREDGGIAINQPIVHHILGRITQYNEWGQGIVLSIASKYRPDTAEEALKILNIMETCLKMANANVVVAACKCFINIAKILPPNIKAQVYARLKTPLLMLMSQPSSEVAFIVLQHLKLIVRLCPTVFMPEVKQFFLRHNEPSAVKFAKLDILPQLANTSNFAVLIGELCHYVNAVDEELNRRTIKAIAKVGLAVSECVDQVIGRLLEFFEMEAAFVRSETVTALKDLMRKYPARCAEVMPAIHTTLRKIDEPVGKSAMVWMIGEFGEMMPEGPYVLEGIIDNWEEETSTEVRLALMTATMKLFFKRSPEMVAMLGRLFQTILTDDETVSPDVHDRALLFYRALQRDIDLARQIVRASEGVADDGSQLADNLATVGFVEDRDEVLHNQLLSEFDSLAVVYEQPSSQFVSEEYQLGVVTDTGDEDEVGAMLQPGADASDPMLAPTPAAAPADSGMDSMLDLMGVDLLGGGAPAPAAPVQPQQQPAAAPGGVGGDLLDDLFGGGGSVAAAPAVRAVQLVPCQLNGQVFEAQWGQLATSSSSPANALSGAHVLANVVGALAGGGVQCLAQGDQGATLKLFLYAQEASGAMHLIQMLVNKVRSSVRGRVVLSTCPPLSHPSFACPRSCPSRPGYRTRSRLRAPMAPARPRSHSTLAHCCEGASGV